MLQKKVIISVNILKSLFLTDGTLDIKIKFLCFIVRNQKSTKI